MKNKDLIRLLQTLPEDMEVVTIQPDYDDSSDIGEILEVMVSNRMVKTKKESWNDKEVLESILENRYREYAKEHTELRQEEKILIVQNLYNAQKRY